MKRKQKLKRKHATTTETRGSPTNGTPSTSNTIQTNNDAAASNSRLPTPNLSTNNSTPSSFGISSDNQNGSTNLQGSVESSIQQESVQPSIDEAENINSVGPNGEPNVIKNQVTLRYLWNMDNGNRIVVSTNEFGQPIGREAQLLNGFIGLVARHGSKCPLGVADFRSISLTSKKQMMDFITKRFLFMGNDQYLLSSIAKKRREFRHTLKTEYKEESATLEENLQVDPEEHLVRDQFEGLVSYWYSDKGEKRSRVGKESRNKQKVLHSNGSRSFANTAYQIEKKTGKKPSHLQLYVATHTKKDGTPINPDSQKVVDDLQNKFNEISASSSAMSENEIEHQAFTEVLGKERGGRIRGLGLGPSPKTYFGAFYSGGSVEGNTILREKYNSVLNELGRVNEEHDITRASWKLLLSKTDASLHSWLKGSLILPS